ncbi:hypothetical protein FKP32DRAFT_1168469 [Trametes sanguinea]|nr:hypothetical protein FKP32DRAFT_1168469 [Trametes sanguinea]
MCLGHHTLRIAHMFRSLQNILGHAFVPYAGKHALLQLMLVGDSDLPASSPPRASSCPPPEFLSTPIAEVRAYTFTQNVPHSRPSLVLWLTVADTIVYQVSASSDSAPAAGSGRDQAHRATPESVMLRYMHHDALGVSESQSPSFICSLIAQMVRRDGIVIPSSDIIVLLPRALCRACATPSDGSSGRQSASACITPFLSSLLLPARDDCPTCQPSPRHASAPPTQMWRAT